MSLLLFVVIILTFIVVINVINRKILHLQQDIANLFFSFLIGIVILVVTKIFNIADNIVDLVAEFNFESYLLDGVLCLMLFAGSSKINIRKFRQNLKFIMFLSLISTAVSSLLFGLMFMSLGNLIGINLDIWTALLLGCIVSPTDPIAATGILGKLGLSKNVLSVIESESLFNDGTGVALFIFVKGFVTHNAETNFALLMGKEIFGALLVGLIISYIMFSIVKRSDNPIMQIVISLLTVLATYTICEHFEFSGVIGSVVCGMMFAYMMNKIERQREVYDSNHVYENFWETVDSILNQILFVMIGINALRIVPDNNFVLLVLVGIVVLLISRFIGVMLTFLVSNGKPMPGNYTITQFSILLTWAALKGGLSLALAMSTKEFLDGITYNIVMNTTYSIIIFTVIIQGLSIKSVYKALEKSRTKIVEKKK